MAIDLEKMKQKLENAENGFSGNNNEESDLWSPEEDSGINFVRFLPDDEGDPFKELHFHYLRDLGGGTHLCEKNNGFAKTCPICDFATDVWHSANGDKTLENFAKTLFVKQRYFSNVYIRNNENLKKPVKLFGYPMTVYKRLLGFVFDPEIGDFTNVKDSYDIKVEKSKGDNDYYAKTSVDAARSKSDLAETKKEIEEILDQRLDPFEIYTRSTMEEIQKDLAKISFSEEADAEGTEKYTKKDDAEEAPVDLDAAFEKLTS